MLVPNERHKDSIQWHLIYNDTGASIQYSNLRLRCPNRMKLDTVDHESLQNTRTFLGWWPTSIVNLGTQDVRYENIKSSKAPPAKTTNENYWRINWIRTFWVSYLELCPWPQ